MNGNDKEAKLNEMGEMKESENGKCRISRLE